MNRWLWLLALLLAGCLPGCGPPKAIHLGFIGSLSDRGSDTGEDGRNGMMLAVEQRNQAGGIHGRMVEILVQDDGMDPGKSHLAIQTLVSAQVDAVVGPFSSAVATVAVPLSNQAGIVMVSPTVTSTDFVGKDDFLIRINRTTRDNAKDYAQVLYQRGQHRMALAYDTRNASYSLAWLNAFKLAYGALGGQVVAAVAFESDARTGFGDVVRKMLAQPSQGLLFIGSAIDVARLAQQAEKLAPQMPKSAAERASTELLLELGGRSVEGLLIAQAFNRDDPSERYLSFHRAFVARFAREPSFSAVLAYDATNVLCQALALQAPGQSLKDSILQHGPFQGLQQSIQFDRFGDTARKVFFTEVRGGKFVLLK
ncbi:ABC transporter substrate-binding protein [Rhodoferax sp.]|uniref:ABC transporter substrate-binding protein n=1 Tax=Rhodoferax sp. TaxID=50421 RepID=UPI0025D490C4|nr:ABC transporter substrate-binding protein [Rhodoferax sp.]